MAGLQVLVVEDEPDSRELIVELLSRWGAQVIAESSCADALARLENSSKLPDLLVSDLGMQKEDGFDLIRKVRALPPARGGRIPAVAVTGYANPDDRRRALAAGFQAHVTKPIDPAKVAAAITLARKEAASSKPG